MRTDGKTAELAKKVTGKALLHYGIKGMQWGRSTRSPTSATVTQKGKKLKTKGGQGQPAHADAIKKATIARTKKKSGTNSLSDAQLKTYANRLELEQRVGRLESQTKSPARRFVTNLLTNAGKQAAQQAANEAATKTVKKALKTKGGPAQQVQTDPI